jgi:hypothetical protein
MASSRGLTLYSLLSDTLGKVVELDASGISLDEAVKGYNCQKMAREIGFTSVPENLWYETAEVSLRADRKGTMTRFGDCGEWIGRYVLAKSQSTNQTEELVKCLSPLSVDASEFSIEGSDTLRLRFVNPRLPPAYTEAFSSLLTRAIGAVGYECETRSHSRGMILLQFHRAKASDRLLRKEVFA